MLTRLIVITAFSCASGPGADTSPKPITNDGSGSAVQPSASSKCAKDSMSEVQRFQETTKPTLSGMWVGIGNIFERELPDANGVVASRMSAVLAIMSRDSDEVRHDTVAVDTVVGIGPDRYCIVSIEEGKKKPGWISLVKVP
jgi:hypothetical protein